MTRKIILFLSSYIPLYVLMILKNIVERCTSGGRFLNLADKVKNMVLFDEVNDWAILFLGIVCIVSFVYLKQKIGATSGDTYYKVIEVADETGNNYFNYISIYLLSCLGMSMNNIVDVFVFVFLMGIVGYIYIANDMIYLNPTLNMMGYKVYNVAMTAMATDEPVHGIVIADKRVVVKKGKEVKGTKKYELIVLNRES